ncbi:uncharacterized protein LOC132062249 [Lycium ferocissimum]|uniref:uncharacterized protein LOC132062249 n=1 Tax=Lycium ferocissimum TaxID=112874 RepID=UPI00281560F6|nr:uncharacterized protein LOC132062249 [Lycium ferocissimum]
MDAKSRLRDWAGLSDLIVDLIFHKLSSISSCLRFGAVCKSWFSFVSKNYDILQHHIRSNSIEELPLLMICTDRKKFDISTSLYNVVKSKTIFDFKLPLLSDAWRCCGSSYGWLTIQHKLYLFIQLFNPFSGETIDLPSLECFAGKIIITKNPSIDRNTFEVAATVRAWQSHEGLAILKPGSNTWDFTCHQSRICDVIYYNERYYVVTDEGIVLTVDNTSLELKETFQHRSIMESSDHSFIKNYLIKTTTDKLLRVQISFPRDNKPSSVKIFKFIASQSNTQRSTSEELDDLGDEALFLCDHCSISVSASKFSGCKANSIYYMDNDLPLELPGNHEYMIDIIHLQYAGGLNTRFSFTASTGSNIPALWIIPTPKLTYF